MSMNTGPSRLPPVDDAPLRSIRERIAGNPHCTLSDLLRRERVVIAEHGSLSYGNDRELFALVADGPDYWYGHVMRVDPAQLVGPACRPWLAILVYARIEIDGTSPESILRSAKRALTRRCEYSPCYAQDPEDTYALRPTFEEACAALAEMVRRFDPWLRIEMDLDEKGLPLAPLDAKLDMRCFNVYGLACEAWDEAEREK